MTHVDVYACYDVFRRRTLFSEWFEHRWATCVDEGTNLWSLKCLEPENTGWREVLPNNYVTEADAVLWVVEGVLP